MTTKVHCMGLTVGNKKHAPVADGTEGQQAGSTDFSAATTQCSSWVQGFQLTACLASLPRARGSVFRWQDTAHLA
jgi:hypothetical protein